MKMNITEQTVKKMIVEGIEQLVHHSTIRMRDGFPEKVALVQEGSYVMVVACSQQFVVIQMLNVVNGEYLFDAAINVTKTTWFIESAYFPELFELPLNIEETRMLVEIWRNLLLHLNLITY